MSSLADIISGVMQSSSMVAELERIRDKAVEELKRSIQDNFYDAYEPKIGGKRTFQFLDSCRGEITITPTGAEINIFLDPALMNHPSVVDGMNSYVPALLYYGHQQSGYDAVDFFHNYPANTEWFDEAFIKIQEMVVGEVKNAIVTAMKPSNYR